MVQVMHLVRRCARHRGIKLALIASLVPFLQGFVLIAGNEEAKLPVAPERPIAVFILSGDAPSIKDKGDFLEGQYAGMSDEELFPILVQYAMDIWNGVPGSYLRLEIGQGDARLDDEDRINSVVIDSISLTAAASAMPRYEDGEIYDCDITIAKRGASADSLAYSILHELGHCLGLGHDHANYGAVMGYSRSSRSLRLGASDMSGLVYLYPDPALGVGEAKEMINCGTIGASRNQRQSAATSLALALLFLPLLAPMLHLREAPWPTKRRT